MDKITASARQAIRLLGFENAKFGDVVFGFFAGAFSAGIDWCKPLVVDNINRLIFTATALSFLDKPLE